MIQFFQRTSNLLSRAVNAIRQHPRVTAALTAVAFGIGYEASRDEPHAILIPIWAFIGVRLYEIPEATRRHYRQLMQYLEHGTRPGPGFIFMPNQQMLILNQYQMQAQQLLRAHMQNNLDAVQPNNANIAARAA